MTCLPDKLAARTSYQPTDQGSEQRLRARLDEIRKLKSKSVSESRGDLMRCALSMITLALLAIPLEPQDQPTRPPITGIAHIRIYSTDLHKSLDFYSKTLGLPPRSGGCTGVSRPCFIINDHQQIGLSQAPSAAPASLLAEVAFTTTDVAAMRRYLLAHNVPTGAITRDFNSLQHFALRDPEGNPIAFVQHPGLQLLSSRPEQAGSRMIHAGFIVKDRAVEDRFYRDLLGFRMYWHGGFKDADNDWWEIQVPEGTDWIEYMLNIPANADAKERGIQNHFSLVVPEIKAAVAKLKADGLQTTDAPEIGRDGKWSFDIYDPDFTRVEFMEFKPVKEPCCNPYTAEHPKP